jgi:hydrogenase maturation protease
MSKILVVGYGNPLRADDGLGCHVARELAHRLGNDKRVEVVPCHQLAPEIAQQIAATEFVIFIDACTEGEPGTITERTVLPETHRSAGNSAALRRLPRCWQPPRRCTAFVRRRCSST